MQVLFLNPYHGGSHREFYEQWSRDSNHTFQLLGLPAHDWKWRMRHGAWSLARVARDLEGQKAIELVLSTDMLDLALWKASAPAQLSQLPHVLYFHENQLHYPDQTKTERDLHFGCTNILSAALADAVWFNSSFHRHCFVEAAADFCRLMPSEELSDAVEVIRRRSHTCPPGVAVSERPRERSKKMRIAWVGRWEWDKGNDLFLRLARRARSLGVEFVVLGAKTSSLEQDEALRGLGECIAHAGYTDSREDYESLLRSSDVVLSTARHEYFGLAVLEAASSGCVPLVPRRLAYPEVFEDCGEAVFYEGLDEGLAQLGKLHERWKTGQLAPPTGLERHRWATRTPRLDAQLVVALELWREGASQT